MNTNILEQIENKADESATKGDLYAKELIKEILEEGSLDRNPRPHYEDVIVPHNRWKVSDDGKSVIVEDSDNIDIPEKCTVKSGVNGECLLWTPAHTISINHKLLTYDLTKGEFPLWTIRPIPTRSAIKEAFWIYQDQSTDLTVLREKYGIKWWDEWDIGNNTIGSVYGETVKAYDQMNNLLNGLKNDPDGRRHIIDLWQLEQFKKPHGLKPCAFLTEWNVRHGKDGVDYLDLMLTQRSSDFLTAGSINQVQYVVLQYMVARHCGYTPGRFSWSVANMQIYDRHIEQAKELLKRKSVKCNPTVWINPEKTDFWTMTPEDVKIEGYSVKDIEAVNPQMSFPIGI